METQIATRAPGNDPGSDRLGGGVAGSFLLHAALAALVLSWAWIFHSGQTWGNAGATSSSIQATMVDSLPLPPRQPTDVHNMLATDEPSPAPIVPAPHTVAVPRPDAIPIPAKTPPKRVRMADKTTPPPPLHPQPAKENPNQVQTGEAAGLNIAMSSTQTKAGTISVATHDPAFGARFPWYVQQITNKVAQQWYTGMLDPQATGHRVYITFQVERDGSLSHIEIAQRSGDSTLDLTALNAVRQIDTFGPLPDAYTGNHIDVTYYFDPPPRQ